MTLCHETFANGETQEAAGGEVAEVVSEKALSDGIERTVADLTGRHVVEEYHLFRRDGLPVDWGGRGRSRPREGE